MERMRVRLMKNWKVRRILNLIDRLMSCSTTLMTSLEAATKKMNKWSTRIKMSWMKKKNKWKLKKSSKSNNLARRLRVKLIDHLLTKAVILKIRCKSKDP